MGLPWPTRDWDGRYFLGRGRPAAADHLPRALLDDCEHSREPRVGITSGIGLFIGMMGLKNGVNRGEPGNAGEHW